MDPADTVLLPRALPVFVVPDLQLVAVFTSQADGPRGPGHLPAIHRIVDENLVPAAAARLAASGRGQGTGDRGQGTGDRE